MITNKTITGSQVITKLLELHGVTTIFGYPGGAIMPIYDALYDSHIKHILCRHEQGAAMAAIGYARTKGVGVCMATSGPGATNLVTGLADAMLDSVPLIAITGQVASALIGTDAFQEMDVFGLSMTCTKHSYLVRDISELAQVLNEAFIVATSGRPGPVLVDITKDVQIASISAQQFAALEQSIPNALKFELPSSSTTMTATMTATIENNIVGHNLIGHKNSEMPDLSDAIELLLSCQKPVLYVGGGVHLGHATQAVRQFQQRYHFPCVSTLKGLGVFCTKQNDDYLGMIGMHGTKPANLIVQQSDLLIAIGARFDDRVTGKLDTFAPNAKVIHLDIDAAEINKLRLADAPLCGEIVPVLAALSNWCDQQTVSEHICPWLDEVAQIKLNNHWPVAEDNLWIHPPHLLAILSKIATEDTSFATDVGQHQMWAAQQLTPSAPEKFLTSAGLGTMGFGLPAAIGAQFANPQSPVVLISGDGSFMMNVQELATITRYKLPIKIILFDNQRLGMVRQWQTLFFKERYSETILDDNPDFVMLANAFDIKGMSIDKPEQIAPALQTMLQHNGAYLLHVVIPNEESVWPLVPPGAANEHMLESY